MPQDVDIRFVAQSRTRDVNREQDWFRKTYMINEAFNIVTDIDSYETDLETVLSQLWTFVSTERAKANTEVSLGYQVMIENVNPADLGKGAYLLPKQQLNGALSADEWDDIDVVRQIILTHIAHLIEVAHKQP